jgi:hypothetical protein
MAKRTPKPADVNRRAVAVVAQATGEDEEPVKDAEAAAHGRNGGQTRAARLTPKERSEAAKKAADARWAKAAD